MVHSEFLFKQLNLYFVFVILNVIHHVLLYRN